MQKFKKFFLIVILGFVLSTSFSSNVVNAAGLFGFEDPPNCPSNDRYLPTLLICGRNPSSGACKEYTYECTVGDLVETGSRIIIFMLSLALLIIPLIIMYYGAMLMWEQKWEGNSGMIKYFRERLFHVVLYFILMLSAWLIVRTVIDIFQVDTSEGRINTFLIEQDGSKVKARDLNIR